MIGFTKPLDVARWSAKADCRDVLDASVKVKITRAMKAAIAREARSAGVSEAEWVRNALCRSLTSG